jgi:hypothetical protein
VNFPEAGFIRYRPINPGRGEALGLVRGSKLEIDGEGFDLDRAFFRQSQKDPYARRQRHRTRPVQPPAVHIIGRAERSHQPSAAFSRPEKAAVRTQCEQSSIVGRAMRLPQHSYALRLIDCEKKFRYYMCHGHFEIISFVGSSPHEIKCIRKREG